MGMELQDTSVETILYELEVGRIWCCFAAFCHIRHMLFALEHP
jgi:hypothetical protein